MHILDWIVVVGFIAASVGIGVYFTKRASRGKDDFFLAGRSLGWFIAGTSIVATTFSSDTPQWVAGLTRDQGISGNWFWWSAAIGQIAAIFFLARYWRRSEAVTEVDFVRLRYGNGMDSRILRIFKSFFDGIFVNCAIMASVTLAMAKIVTIVVFNNEDPTVTTIIGTEITRTAVILAVLTVFVIVYCTLSGLYGVVYTDLFQFVFAMVGAIALAVFMYVDASGGEGLIAKLEQAPGYDPNHLQMIPDLTVWNAASFSFFLFIGVVWWMSFPTGGFHVQRLLSTKNEVEATKAFLWYNIANYVLRSWPWVIVGMLGVIYYPDLAPSEYESTYARAIADFLPFGFKGIMVAAFLAAYMSTISTHLNWGTSYLINDVYQPFIHKNASPKQVVLASRITMIALAVFAAIVATKLESMIKVFQMLGIMWAGVGTVLIARWYWWRITATTEMLVIGATLLTAYLINAPASWLPVDISPILSLFGHSEVPKEGAALGPVFTGLTHRMVGGEEQPGWIAVFCVQAAFMTFAMTFVWLAYVLLFSRQPTEAATTFYKKIRIKSPGWKKVEQATGYVAPSGEFLINIAGWLLTCLALFGLMLSVGSFIFLQWVQGLIYLAICVLASTFLFIGSKKYRRPTQASSVSNSTTPPPCS